MDNDEPTYDPEDCEHCKRENENDGVEYEQNVTWKDGQWICDNCGRPV